MNERRWGQVGALSGVLFVMLTVLGAFIYPQQPPSDSSASVTVAWVHDHRTALQAGMIVSLFAAAALIWFAGYLRSLLGDGRDGPGRLGPVVLGSGVAVAVLAAVAVVPTALMAFMDSQPAGLHDASLVRMLGDLNTVFFAVVSVMCIVFLAALGVVMLLRAFSTPWLGWLAILFSVVNGVAVWVEITFSSYHGKAWNAVGWGAFIGFLAVVLLTSLTTLGGRAEAPEPSLSVP